MGYFSNLAISLQDRPLGQGQSLPSPEFQLKMRLQDLIDQFHELNSSHGVLGGQCAFAGQYDSGISFARTELAYILPEHLNTISDVMAAIEIAKETLDTRYGVEVDENDLPTFAHVSHRTCGTRFPHFPIDDAA